MNILGVSVSIQPATSRQQWTRRLVVLGALNAAVLSAGTAYAVWSASGSGSGGAAASSAVTATVTATTTTVDAALWPGNTTAAQLRFTINNPNPYPVSYTSFSGAAFGTITPGPVSGGTCDAGKFALTATSGSLASPVAVAANGSAQVGLTPAILKMLSTAPDSCQGATITVTLTVTGTQT